MKKDELPRVRNWLLVSKPTDPVPDNLAQEDEVKERPRGLDKFIDEAYYRLQRRNIWYTIRVVAIALVYLFKVSQSTVKKAKPTPLRFLVTDEIGPTMDYVERSLYREDQRKTNRAK